MQKDDFIMYLCTRYRGQCGRHLSQRGASDAASRLQRLERAFNFSIEALIESLEHPSRENLIAAIDAILDGDPKCRIPTQGLNDGRSAAAKYLEFVKWKAMRAEALRWQSASRSKV